MGRKIQSKLDLLFPSDPIVKYTRKDTRNDVRNQFKPGDTVIAKDFRTNQQWLEGGRELNNSIAWIRLPDGRYIRRYTSHLRLRGSKTMIIYNTIVPERENDLYEETKERFDSRETIMT